MRLIHKLFILFSLTSLFAALAMAGALAWNLNRGFSQYLAASDAEMLENFAGKLEDSLNKELLGDGTVPNSEMIRVTIDQLAREGSIADLPRRPASELPRTVERPANQGAAKARRGRPPGGFGSRLRVIDAQGQPVFGPPPAPAHIEVTSASRQIAVDGKLIATAKLLPRGPISQSTDQIFLRNQYVGGAIVTAALLVLSGLIAWGLARAGVDMASEFRHVTS